jgi:hypothetical protein
VGRRGAESRDAPASAAVTAIRVGFDLDGPVARDIDIAIGVAPAAATKSASPARRI